MPATSFSPIGERGGRLLDEVPGRFVGHLEIGLLEEIGAVHREGGLAVERRPVERALVGEPGADARQQVVDVVVAGEIVERGEPVALGPDRRLVGPDGDDVEPPAARRDVGGDALAKRVLVEHDPVELDVGVLLDEARGQLLHPHHVAVLHRGDGDRLGRGVGG